MSATVARSLKPVDSLEVSVLVDNVVDPLSTLPKGVTGEQAVLRAKGLMVSSGHVRCCANHGKPGQLSLSRIDLQLCLEVNANADACVCCSCVLAAVAGPNG